MNTTCTGKAGSVTDASRELRAVCKSVSTHDGNTQIRHESGPTDDEDAKGQAATLEHACNRFKHTGTHPVDRISVSSLAHQAFVQCSQANDNHTGGKKSSDETDKNSRLNHNRCNHHHQSCHHHRRRRHQYFALRLTGRKTPKTNITITNILFVFLFFLLSNKRKVLHVCCTAVGMRKNKTGNYSTEWGPIQIHLCDRDLVFLL